MNPAQRLFVVQARSTFVVYRRLEADRLLAECHCLHLLQMTTELLGKAYSLRSGPNTTSHRAFVRFMRELRRNRKVQTKVDFRCRNASWAALIRNSIPLAERIEDLAPSLAGDGPNPEYPWPRTDPVVAPAEHSFDLWHDLQNSPDGRSLLDLLDRLLATAEAYL